MKEYRLSIISLWFGIVATLCFGLMDVFSVLAAATNMGRSFRYPVPTAIVFGCFWSCPTLVGVWYIVAYCRRRLYVSFQSLRAIGCFRTVEIALPLVRRAVWKPAPGRLVLHDPTGKLSISLDDYALTERQELVRFFRGALAQEIQEGWERFEVCRAEVEGTNAQWELVRKRGRRRYVWMYGIFKVCLLSSPLIIGMWLSPRFDRRVPAILLSIVAAVGCLVGMHQWKARERAFLSSQRRRIL